MVAIRIDPFPSNDEMNGLWAEAWDAHDIKDFGKVLARSLTHLGAYDRGDLVGFVNVAWDGGVHAFILDICVHPRVRRKGIATQLINVATHVARDRGAAWLHVDFEAQLISFYRNCGFEPTEAGLMRLT